MLLVLGLTRLHVDFARNWKCGSVDIRGESALIDHSFIGDALFVYPDQIPVTHCFISQLSAVYCLIIKIKVINYFSVMQCFITFI
jgi:hypothetical protein